MTHRLNSNVCAVVGLLGLSAAALIGDTRRAEACRMPLRKSAPAATLTPEGCAPKRVVLVDKQTVLSEQTRAELEWMQREDEGGALDVLLDPFAEVRQLLQDLAPVARRSPFADRGSYPRAPRWLRRRKSLFHRSARNQTRPQGHVVRALRTSRQSH